MRKIDKTKRNATVSAATNEHVVGRFFRNKYNKNIHSASCKNTGCLASIVVFDSGEMEGTAMAFSCPHAW